MTRDETCAVPLHTPVVLLDGNVGRTSHCYVDSGALAIDLRPGWVRVIPCANLSRRADGTIVEHLPPSDAD